VSWAVAWSRPSGRRGDPAPWAGAHRGAGRAGLGGGTRCRAAQGQRGELQCNFSQGTRPVVPTRSHPAFCLFCCRRPRAAGCPPHCLPCAARPGLRAGFAWRHRADPAAGPSGDRPAPVPARRSSPRAAPPVLAATVSGARGAAGNPPRGGCGGGRRPVAPRRSGAQAEAPGPGVLRVSTSLQENSRVGGAPGCVCPSVFRGESPAGLKPLWGEGEDLIFAIFLTRPCAVPQGV
jgi:hypothetical protein